MSRTAQLKILYLSLIVLLIGGFLYLQLPLKYSLIVVVLFLALGRISGYFLRDLIAARKLMSRRKWRQAISLLERFVERSRTQRWLNLMLWLSPSFYTTNTLALALNNLGVSHLELRELGRAESYLKEALAIDKLYALPHYNLAILEHIKEDFRARDEYLKRARRLGFSGGTIDRVLDRVKTIYSHIEPMASPSSENTE